MNHFVKMFDYLIDSLNGTKIKAPETSVDEISYHITGNNRVCCRGFCITGPNIIPLCFTLGVYFIFFLLFAACSIPWFISHNYYAIPILNTLIFTLTMALLILTSFKDPGVIPRQKVPKYTIDYKQHNSVIRNPKRMFNSIINSSTMVIRYCETCNIYRPPRSTHCKECKNCVERFDHHCIWLGNCIGRRNYKFFFFYLFMSVVYGIAFIASSIYKIVLIATPLIEQGDPNWLPNFLLQSVDSLVISIVGIVPLAVMIALFYQHITMVYTNETTFERFHGQWEKVINPFDRGPWGNIKDILFNSTPKRLINWRNPEIPEYTDDMENVNKQFFLTQSQAIEHIKRKIQIQLEEYDLTSISKDPKMFDDICQSLYNYSSTRTSIPTESNDTLVEFSPKQESFNQPPHTLV